jgi:hypothetical protein
MMMSVSLSSLVFVAFALMAAPVYGGRTVTIVTCLTSAGKCPNATNNTACRTENLATNVCKGGDTTYTCDSRSVQRTVSSLDEQCSSGGTTTIWQTDKCLVNHHTSEVFSCTDNVPYCGNRCNASEWWSVAYACGGECGKCRGGRCA